MRALTVIQPWAWYIAEGLKPIENRRWPPPPTLLEVGQRFAIHAGKADIDLPALQHGWDWYGREVPLAELERGAVIATAELAGVVFLNRWSMKRNKLRTHSGPPNLHRTLTRAELRWYREGDYGWVLRNVRILTEPVPANGAQKLWALPADVNELVLARGG